MVSGKATVVNAMGFHMRPATVFANAMTKYPCDITLKANGNDANGKSLMNIIAVGIRCGTEVEIVCEGEREEEALAEAIEMIRGGLGE